MMSEHGYRENTVPPRTRYMKNRNIHLFMILWCSHRLTSSVSKNSSYLSFNAGMTVSFKYSRNVWEGRHGGINEA
jgi:uncharacterized protein YlaI